MFEFYTEKARRAVFFARYEASRYGSSAIETEHLLLGLIRENVRFSKFRLTPEVAEAIRKQIDTETPAREPTSTTTDIPLTSDSRLVLAYAAEEAEHFGDKHIGTEHLFPGLLREERGLAAQILKQYGVSHSQLRTELAEGRLGPPCRSRFLTLRVPIAWRKILSISTAQLGIPNISLMRSRNAASTNGTGVWPHGFPETSRSTARVAPCLLI